MGDENPGGHATFHLTDWSGPIFTGGVCGSATPVAPGLIPFEDLKHASAFELRVGGRVLGVLPLSPVPTATFTAEGGYKPPPDFSWNATADDELSERLARLMGLPPPG